jgi:Multicopper oxidase
LRPGGALISCLIPTQHNKIGIRKRPDFALAWFGITYAMLSRREMLAGVSVCGACKGFQARAQPLPVTEFRLLRALSGAPPGPALSYDGSVPGPTLRIKRGEELRIRLFNGLADPTSIHWHGVRLPNAMDGVPMLTQPAVMPNSSFDYRFRCPDAGTFWYHSQSSTRSTMGYTALLSSRNLRTSQSIAM